MRKKRSKTSSFTYYVLLLVILVIALTTTHIIVSKTRPEPQDSVVAILNRTGTGGGTGFVTRDVAGKHVIVTNDHVCDVESGGYVVVISDSNQSYLKRVLKRNFIRDLCVVEGIDAPPLSLATGLPTKFEELKVIGHPLLGPTTPSKGVFLKNDVLPIRFNTKPDGTCPKETTPVESLFEMFCIVEMELSRTTIPIYPGNSGSPVLNQNGEVIGVINSADRRTTYGYFVPLNYLRDILGDKN